MTDILETQYFDEEILSPEQYLGLSDEQRRDIARLTPFVQPLGTVGLDSSFAALHVKWKTPRYEVRF